MKETRAKNRKYLLYFKRKTYCIIVNIVTYSIKMKINEIGSLSILDYEL